MVYWQQRINESMLQVQEHPEDQHGVYLFKFRAQNLCRTFDDLQAIRKREREKLKNNARDLQHRLQHLEGDRAREEESENRKVEAQQRLDECQRAANIAEQEFYRKEKDTDYWMMMAALIGGTVRGLPPNF